jgi:regulator of protease activity HflC (stomatin/prohibitin superfamily)
LSWFLTATVVAEHQRGVRLRGGRAVAFLEPGRHWTWFPAAGDRVETFDVTAGITPWQPALAVVPSEAARVVEVPFRSVGVVSIEGVPTTGLLPGRWLAWNAGRKVDVALVSTADLLTTLPEAAWPALPPGVLQDVVVLPHERVLLYVDGVLDRVLGPGRHGVFVAGRTVAPVKVDLREQELTITGQESMTQDKVTLRVTVLVRFRVVDPVKALSEVANLRDGLYAVAQLAARSVVGAHALDALLDARTGAAEALAARVAPRLAGWGVELCSLDLKDLVLPGEMKTILNQVIEAEKRAAANLILRREEIAATRSLANTAKLLEQNPTLLRLKELESMEWIAEKVERITVVAAPGEVWRTLSLPAAP